jgi:hypothetical protein
VKDKEVSEEEVTRQKNIRKTKKMWNCFNIIVSSYLTPTSLKSFTKGMLFSATVFINI